MVFNDTPPIRNSSEIIGFSKFTKLERINLLAENILKSDFVKDQLESFWHSDFKCQKILDEFSENVVSNFFMPYSIVPNMIVDGKRYCVPMVIEESSVVAAASKSAKFWASRGGFKTEIVSTLKVGQVHFYWGLDYEKVKSFFLTVKDELLIKVASLTSNMEQRGGGIVSLELVDCSHEDKGYYQLKVSFETCDAMGANFINTVLESISHNFKLLAEDRGMPRSLEVIMAILSNYTPDCLVRVSVSCSISNLTWIKNGEISPGKFAKRFERAVRIASINRDRAVTHNKGIFNGIDAVVLATGNDFRATEACGHAYAAKDGAYRGLSFVNIEDDVFKFWYEIPLALGTVGGLTSLHPLAKISLDILDHPDSRQLMSIVASMGLAQNFAAVSSLVTTGIQKGHMKMHLMNILNHLDVSSSERIKIKDKFKDEVISFQGVRDFLSDLRA